MATEKKYWKGIAELESPVMVENLAANEFAEEMPTADFLGNEKLGESKTSRRDFLKFMGFSTAAATLAACEAPVVKSIPYVIKPDSIVPGVPNYYASTFFRGNEYASVLVKTREGRPIKLEPNALSKVNPNTSARVQGSVLSLYDSGRLQGPMMEGNSLSWADADAGIKSELAKAANAGKEIALLTGTVISPSLSKLIEDFKGKYATARHYQYDAVGYDAILDANKEAFGKRALPTLHFDKADVIVSLSADFLGEWINLGYSTDYIQGRNPNVGKMNRHIQFESILSISGANADLRHMIKPSELGKVALALYNEIAGAKGASTYPVNAPLNDEIKAVAKELMAATGKAIVVCGSDNMDVQKVVIAINQMLESYGSTMDMNNATMIAQGNHAEVKGLIAEMNAGKVGALVMADVNPLYTCHDAAGFEAGMAKVGTTISLSDRLDETCAKSVYQLPLSHYLESWGDHMPVEGSYSLQQPAIQKIFNSRQLADCLLAWTDNGADYASYLGSFWSANLPIEVSWSTALHDGVFENGTGATPTPASLDLSAAANAIAAMKGGAFELQLYTKTGMGEGYEANNPWLQEMPDPITRTSWDNYLTVNASDARELGFVNENESNGALNGSYVTLTMGDVTIEYVPVLIQPGQARGTFGLALGYGRTMAGKAGDGVGVNAYPLYKGSSQVMDVSAAKGDGMHGFACIQLHHTMMGRSIVKETTLANYINDPKSGNPDVMFETHKGKKPASQVDLWQDFDKETGHWWNLSMDLNNCIGCGACVVACQAENNVPVVGKEEVRKHRDMHWIRIDRYYSSDMTEEVAEENGVGYREMNLKMEVASESPEVVFQPIMCQHCNHAPCETVCPVAATSHSSEGLNHMAYNRCIGTRYCANNCPYKVRRFNWFTYSENGAFDFNMNDDLGKMVLNPDVTVRARGVMEKCSMCIQRIQLGKLEAKREGRPVKDGDIQTACSSACGTGAIIFGDVNDEKSQVAQLKHEPRRYYLLEEVGTKPSVFYQTKVRNKLA